MLTDPRQMRHHYQSDGLAIAQMDQDPILQFDSWFKQARDADLMEPNAMALASADANGKPSLRMVLLKEFSHQGFVFYSNYQSRKAQEIDQNSQVSLMFWWDQLFRQVRIEGSITKNDPTDADAYFASRPHGSRIGAIASNQSRKLNSRADLEKRWHELEQRFPDEVPRPDHWGGYIVKPSRFEFWQGQRSRLHDRIIYQLHGNDWQRHRIAP